MTFALSLALLLAATTCAASTNPLLEKRKTSTSTTAPLFRRAVSSKIYLKRKRKEEEDAKEKEATEGDAIEGNVESSRTIVDRAPIPLRDSPSTAARSDHTAEAEIEHASGSGKNTKTLLIKLQTPTTFPWTRNK